MIEIQYLIIIFIAMNLANKYRFYNCSTQSNLTEKKMKILLSNAMRLHNKLGK